MEHIKTINEFWKDIQGYEGLYQVSNFGRVKSLKGHEKILKPANNGKGYLFVYLWKNGKGKQSYIHRLVATMFIPNLDNKPCINHIDCNPLNNNIVNLEWCTQQENLQYAYKLGRMNRRKTPIIAINLTTKEETYFESIREAARQLDLNRRDINNVLKGRQKRTGNYTFKYIDEKQQENTLF